MGDKKGFVLYYDYREHLELLTDEERGQLLIAVFDYGETGVIPELSGAVRMAFSFIKAQMDRDGAKYAKRCAKNAENGAKGGRPNKPTETEENPAKPTESEENQAEPTEEIENREKPTESEDNPTKANESENNPKKPKKSDRFLEKPKKADTDTDKDTDTDTDTDNTPLPPKGESDAPNESPLVMRFEVFWDAYPKKVGKQYALKAWQKVHPTAELFDRIMEAVRAQKKSEQWRRDNGRYIPNPATWLNGGYWDNEPPEEVSADGPVPEPARVEQTDAELLRGFKTFDE